MKDKDGYLLVEKEFTLRGYKFKFIKQLKNDWCIYEKIKKEEAGVKTRNKHIHKKYELVKLRRQESYVFNDKKIERNGFIQVIMPLANLVLTAFL